MNVLIVGAGALGSLFGGLLARADARVTLFNSSNRQHVEKIKTEGLIIEDLAAASEVRIHLEACAQPTELAAADLIGVFTKAHQTESAMQMLKPILTADTWVLSLQNGVGSEEVIARFVHHDLVLRGTTSLGATLLEPGRVRWAGRGPTRLGVWGSQLEQPPAFAQRVISLLHRAGLECDYVPDVERLLIDKLFVNAAINPLTALFDVHNGALIAEAPLRAVMSDVVWECVRVFENEGFSFDEVLTRVEEVCRRTAENISSMLQDVRRGRATEIDYINGAIVRRGEERDIPTPLNRLLLHLIRRRTACSV